MSVTNAKPVVPSGRGYQLAREVIEPSPTLRVTTEPESEELPGNKELPSRAITNASRNLYLGNRVGTIDIRLEPIRN